MLVKKIGNTEIQVKDYYCSDGFEYFPRMDGKLWLYVNLTDVCNGRCPFCINPGRKTGYTPFDIKRFRYILEQIKNHVYGVSLTGGEPMLIPDMVDEAADIVLEIFGHSVELDMVTNGTGFESITKGSKPSLEDIEKKQSVS